MKKPYKAKSIKSAQRRVRELQRLFDEAVTALGQYAKDRRNLAKLAAEGPAFFNPIEVAAIKRLRDEILRSECKLNPDGTIINEAGAG